MATDLTRRMTRSVGAPTTEAKALGTILRPASRRPRPVRVGPDDDAAGTSSTLGPRRPRSARLSGIRAPFDAVIFDMDGVVTDTARIHADAWARLFAEVFSRRPKDGGPVPAPFTPADYARYVDGRSREDGITSFLASRGIRVSSETEGAAGDGLTVSALATRKNAIFLELIATRGVRVFPGTAAMLRRLKAGGVPIGLVTASANAESLLTTAGVRDLFDQIVDGNTARETGLPGKPDPATFLEAARRLGVHPCAAAVVEDAIAGVQAARRGGFGLVVGIAREGNRAELEAAGADIVVEDASQFDLGSFRADPWVLTYDGFDPAHEGHREALTTLANGYLGTRGAAPESRNDGVHYPGTYLAGVYNRLTSVVDGREVEHEHLVNQPNWLSTDLRLVDGTWWSTGELEVCEERRELDMRAGILTRRLTLRDPSGRRLTVTQHRLVSMARPHVAALQTVVVADNWDGGLVLRSGIDAGVTNSNVADDAQLANLHLTAVTTEVTGADTVLVDVETSQSRVGVAMAAGIAISEPTAVGQDVEVTPGHRALEFSVELARGVPVVLDKVVAVVSSRDPAISSPRVGALAELARAPRRFEELANEHRAAWKLLWDQSAVDLEGSSAQDRLALDLHLFHLLQTLSTHTASLDAGVCARGLHGEGYRGHVFWDELFVLQFLIPRLPAVARSLLEYRFRRLPAARDAARRSGLKGAMFPWQSGSDGREETPDALFNPKSGRWMPDRSHRQRHVGLAVAYNAWHYYVATGDLGWLTARGAELIIEVARLFTSLSRYDPAEDRFHIDSVMGPDEYHDGYPGRPGTGVRDNAYTNVVVAWVCARAGEVLGLLREDDAVELKARIGWGDAEPAAWDRVSRRMFVPFHDGVISQFDGYEALAELNLQRYRSTYGNIGRLDLILEAEGDSTNRYKVAKQADVVMLIHLFGVDGLLDLLARLGFAVGRSTIVETVDYYAARTVHGSTLSRVVHAAVLAQLGRPEGWLHFREAMVADLDDTQGGTTAEGVHLGAMAATVEILIRSFAGMRTGAGDELVFAPQMPSRLRRLTFRARARGQTVQVELQAGRVVVSGRDCDLRVRVNGVTQPLCGDARCEFVHADAGEQPHRPEA